MKKEDYNTALSYFQQIVKIINFSSTTLEQDAYVRSADCYFMLKNYKQALMMYEIVISQNGKASDYALFQKAIIAGASNKSNEKIYLLQSIAKQYPNSGLLPEANLEVANTYLADEKYAESIEALNAILKDKNAVVFWPKAYLKSGVSYFNLNKEQEALHNFTQLVAKYPNSEESDEAIEYIRNIFIAAQNPSDFIAFMKQNGKPITFSEEDSLTFHAAQLRYDAKDYANAKQGLGDYLSKFPEGKYVVEVNYFSAEISNSTKDYKAALPLYNAVTARTPNQFAERSALQSARIYYFELKDFTHAATYFSLLKSISSQQENKLEAIRGLLRCQYKLQQWKEAFANAQELLAEKGTATDDKMMANMILAKNYQLDNEAEQAITAYKQVIALGKSEFSAEAQHAVAFILFQQNKLAEAEKAGFEVIKKYGSYSFWVTKSYILLGDVYFKQNDIFNAEATFKSVVENAAQDVLKSEAQQKLEAVIEQKNKSTKVEQQ